MLNQVGRQYISKGPHFTIFRVMMHFSIIIIFILILNFLSISILSPFHFCVKGFVSNHRKVFIPSSFNMSAILKSVHRQESVDLVCDQDFYELEAPGPVAAEYKDKCSSVKSVIVAGTG